MMNDLDELPKSRSAQNFVAFVLFLCGLYAEINFYHSTTHHSIWSYDTQLDPDFLNWLFAVNGLILLSCGALYLLYRYVLRPVLFYLLLRSIFFGPSGMSVGHKGSS